MTLQRVKVAALSFCALLNTGCFSLVGADGDWEELSTKDALAKLSVHFVVTPEMKIVGGQIRTLAGLDDGNEWFVFFTLPDNLAPEDWLTSLIQEARLKQVALRLEKISKYRYCDHAYRGDDCVSELVYRESESRYHFYHYYPPD